tara:strand:- start:139 stop:507 length:369 start_codon:yes stop_codon:yes gene_type:complete
MNLSNNVNDCNGFFDNKYMIGITMVIVNLGARFIVNELNEEQKKFINTKYLRRIVIFFLIFMATRDIVISLVLTVIVILVIFEFFNEDSEYSLVTKKVDVKKNEELGKNEKIEKIIEELKMI